MTKKLYTLTLMMALLASLALWSLPAAQAAPANDSPTAAEGQKRPKPAPAPTPRPRRPGPTSSDEE